MVSSHAIYAASPVYLKAHPAHQPRPAVSVAVSAAPSPQHGGVTCSKDDQARKEEGSLSRRPLVLIAGIAVTDILSPVDLGTAAVAQEDDAAVKEFVDKDKGYKLVVPAAWEMVGKAGADALFRNPSAKSTTVGVTVYPSKVMSTQDFGTLEEAENKLVAAETAKDGFIDLQMLEKNSRLGEKGALFYTFNYELLSSRGRKRILTSVSIFTKNLFIATATYKCAKTSCDVDQSKAEIESLKESIDSFDILL